jgi:hypothetical protein
LERTLFLLSAYIAIKEVVAVIPDLLWIISLYVAAAVIVHRSWGRRVSVDRRQYVLVAGNHQMQIEWYIRGLQQFSQRTGTEIGITVVLNDSSDETGSIMEKFARQDEAIAVIRRESSMQSLSEPKWECLMPEHAIWVELSRKEEVTKLPL